MSGHANTGGITKETERPGRGCECCPDLSRKKNRKGSRRTARRIAKQRGWGE